MIRTLIALVVAVACARPAAAGVVEQADALLREGRVEPALIQVRTHLETHPDDVGAHELLIDILLNTGRVAEVRNLYRNRAVADDSSADAWYLLGRAEPDPSRADAAYRHALSLDVEHARSWMGIGAVAQVRGQHATAAEAYATAANLDSQLIEAWNGLRSSWLALGDRAAALEATRRSTQAIPTDRDGWLALAALDASNAIAHLEQARSYHPTDPSVHLALARFHFEARQWDRAAQAYARTMELHPTDPATVRVEAALVEEIRSGALTAEGARAVFEVRELARDSPSGAIGRMQGLIDAHPHSGWLRLVRGNLLNAADRQIEAEVDLRAAVDRMPGSPEAWQALGLLLLDTRRPAEARPFLARAAQARPDDVVLVVAAAMCAADAGMPADAVTELTRAIERFPSSSGPVLGLARVRLSLGDPDAAYDVVASALHQHVTMDLALALAAAAREAGRPEEAARVLDGLATQTGDRRFASAAGALRADAKAKAKADSQDAPGADTPSP